ncbi:MULTISPECIES: carbohydrate-binding protein [Deefgea]|uniref:carbohydrate-binding protein n=1 Tax=Deefgea TaxID=400947 RepID=UPI00194157FC|nr:MULTISPECIES: carbohydrate-binding protein [Deefgea]MBM9887521.1 prepilin-type N-terminal cleavage/methylation domain-containing protein [Deefgea sp. CFH1-16]
MTSKFKNNGFSLIEVLITVIILAGAGIALTKFQAIQMQGTSDARNRNEALALAQGLLDDYRKDFQTGNIADKAATDVTGKSATFSVSGEVTDLSIVTGETIPGPTPVAAPFPKQVVANVSWANAQGQSQEVVLSTILRYNAQSFAVPVAATPTPTAGPTATPTPTPAPVAAWSSSTSYSKDDQVSFNGHTYKCVNPTGCKPPADPNWTPAVVWNDWSKQ